jgi:hypothetical protein
MWVNISPLEYSPGRNGGSMSVAYDNWTRFTTALTELLLTCSPFLVLLLGLWFFGKLDTILDRTDLALLSGVLFADGSLRSLKSSLVAKSRASLLATIGLIGALLCTAAGIAVLVSEDLTSVPKLAVIARTGTFTYGAFLVSLFYSLCARYLAPDFKPRSEA